MFYTESLCVVVHALCYRVRGLFCEDLCEYLKFHRADQLLFLMFICLFYLHERETTPSQHDRSELKVGIRGHSVLFMRSSEESS